MTGFQSAVVLLCFWPVVAIGFPFFVWLRHERMLRYSLRSLLIATTLVALVLGLIVSSR
jgi:hypothetical protein